jgi:hypothetical protein
MNTVFIGVSSSLRAKMPGNNDEGPKSEVEAAHEPSEPFGLESLSSASGLNVYLRYFSQTYGSQRDVCRRICQHLDKSAFRISTDFLGIATGCWVRQACARASTVKVWSPRSAKVVWAVRPTGVKPRKGRGLPARRLNRSTYKFPLKEANDDQTRT